MENSAVMPAGGGVMKEVLSTPFVKILSVIIYRISKRTKPIRSSTRLSGRTRKLFCPFWDRFPLSSIPVPALGGSGKTNQ